MRRLAAFFFLTSCAGTFGQPGWRDSPPNRVAAASVFAPTGEPAAHYNDPAPPPPRTPLIDRVLATVASVCEKNGRAAPTADSRLFAVASEIAALPIEGPPPGDVVEFALGYHGIIEPSPHLIFLSTGPDDDVTGELAERLPRLMDQAPFARVGVGMGNGGQTLVIALQESFVETEPIPRELPRGGGFRLRGRVLHPYVAPRLYVTMEDGTVGTPPVVRDGQAGFGADVRCGVEPGPIKVEIVGEDRADNPTVLANFAVRCGEPAPRTIALATSDGGDAYLDAPTTARDIFALVNQDRAHAGLAPLAWDDRAAAIAVKHADEMRDKEFVAHVSPTTGSTADRARAGGLATPLLLENLARAYSATEVEEGLMASPGHRANLLSAQATHLGVGVAIGHTVGGRHELYVTQLFFRRPPIADRQAARAATIAAFDKARRDARLAPLVVDDALGAIADRYAEELARGQKSAAADADAAIDQLADRFRNVVEFVGVVGDPTERVPPDLLEKSARIVGVGLAQGPHPDLGEGAYYLVVLIAQSR